MAAWGDDLQSSMPTWQWHALLRQQADEQNRASQTAHTLQVNNLNSQVSGLKEEVIHLKEQLWSGGVSYDPDMYLPPQGGGSLFFNRLSQGTRELNPLQQQRAIELAYLLYESNPLGKAIVETVRDFVLGDQPKVTSSDPDEKRRMEQQQVIDAFWNDYVNLMPVKLPNKVMELGLFGEQIYTVEVNNIDGHVRLGYIDPAAVQKVLVDPLNVERQLAVITYIRDVMGMPEEKWYKIIAPDENPKSNWFGRLTAMEGIIPGWPTSAELGADADSVAGDTNMGPTSNIKRGGDDAENGEVGFIGDRSVGIPPIGAKTNTSASDRITWYDSKGELQTHHVDGSCFYFTVNRVSNATRGRTDMLSLVDWVDAFDQLLFNEMDRGLFLKAFIWDVKLEGYNDNQIAEYKKANPQPRPGAVRYHNERVEWKAETPSLNAADSSVLADLILSYIATGARLPKTWLNGMMDVNKATAQELGTPALARLSLRQEYVKYMIQQIITLVLDEAEMHNQIQKRQSVSGQLRPAPWHLEINLPDLKQVNQMAVAQAINNVVVGLGLAVEQGLIDIVIARQVVVMFIEQMGVHIDQQAMVDRIKQNPPVMPAGSGGIPGAGNSLGGNGAVKSGNSPVSLTKGQNLPTPQNGADMSRTRMMQSEQDGRANSDDDGRVTEDSVLKAVREALKDASSSI